MAVALMLMLGATPLKAQENMEKNMPQLSEAAQKNHDQWFPGYVSKNKQTDPELIEIFDNFAFDEVLQNSPELDLKTRIMVTMASCIAQNTIKELRMMLLAAYSNGITPVEIKEIVYHSVPYVGMAKAIDALTATNEFLQEQGVQLPLPAQKTVSRDERREKGQEIIDNMMGKRPAGEDRTPEGQKHIQTFLASNCFGDYQTRPALNAQQRELLTFSMLISLGGCENQVRGHIKGNVAVGNDKALMLAVVTQLLPYNGYPRTLNALACLNEMIPE